MRLKKGSVIILRDVVEVEELSEPEFIEHGNTAAISTSGFYSKCFRRHVGRSLIIKKILKSLIIKNVIPL